MIPIAELFSLSGKTALVTGASSGIGRLMASTLAEAGAAVVLAARDAGRLDGAVTAVRAAGGQAQRCVCDLGRREEIDRLAEQATVFFGPPDILVNAAGVNPRPLVEHITRETWDGVMAVNLDAPFFLAQRLAPAMRARGWGRIINISSQQAIRAFNNSGAYGVSKGGISAMTRALAEAWSRDGVNCNAIAPGYVPTGMTGEVFDGGERERRAASLTLVDRNGMLEDLRGITVFLASRASDYVTGQTIFVDGGMSAH
ncbi:MAG: SDR family oxidoreductase [Burkholderiales bacterium]|nr:SDR family oxidoreductase [Burkholderiales bacterium]